MRAQFLGDDVYHFEMEDHPYEKNGWYGLWTDSPDHKYIVDNPEWWFVKKLHSEFSTFVSEASGTSFAKYTMRARIRRRWEYYVKSIAVVLFLLVILEFNCHLMAPEDLSDRLSSTFTLLLTVVTPPSRRSNGLQK